MPLPIVVDQREPFAQRRRRGTAEQASNPVDLRPPPLSLEFRFLFHRGTLISRSPRSNERQFLPSRLVANPPTSPPSIRLAPPSPPPRAPSSSRARSIRCENRPHPFILSTVKIHGANPHPPAQSRPFAPSLAPFLHPRPTSHRPRLAAHPAFSPLEVPQFFGHKNSHAPVNKGQHGDLRFAASENPTAGARRRSRGRGREGGSGVRRHPVFKPKNSKSGAAASFPASAGSKPRHLPPRPFRTSLAPSAMA